MATDTGIDDITQTLGEYLRQTRVDKGLDILELAEETKVSLAILTAIEEDNYQALPSATFARGLYSIYAKSLGLDSKEVLEKYNHEVKKNNEENEISPTPSRLAKEIGNMAERPQGAPTLIFALAFFIISLLIALVCWYYSINPARLVSEKLRSLQGVPPISTDLVETPGTGPSKYVVEAYFPEPAIIQVYIDNLEPKDISIQAGENLQWTANQALKFILPADIKAKFYFNDEIISLPLPENEEIILSFPQPADKP